jgi:hypothetical protein
MHQARSIRVFCIVASLLFAGSLRAQPAPSITGSFTATRSDGAVTAQGTFNCSGSGTCTGTYNAAAYPVGCSNPTLSSGEFTLTGVAIGQAGAHSGRVVLRNALSEERENPDGSCTVSSRSDLVLDFTGQSDGVNGTFAGSFPGLGNTGPITVNGSFRTSASQVPEALQGTLSGSNPLGANVQAQFTCSGGNPCIGTYSGSIRPHDCSNAYQLSGQFTMTGLDLSRAGPISGQMRFTRFFVTEDRVMPGGICVLEETGDLVIAFTGTWNGNSATLSIPPMQHEDGPIAFSASFQSGTAPAFTVAVNSRIDNQTATVTATMQPRPEDLGRTQSVYVFALAPQSLVQPRPVPDPMPPLAKAQGKGPKADAIACVLAQLNASNQLVAVSASSMQAFVTGALSANGTAVTIANGVPTVNIGGATFYVGYGTTAQGMLANGNTVNAVTVPGQRECRPQPPQTGWWWQPVDPALGRSPRDGTGYSLEAQGSLLFFAAFLYDESGRASWYVASGRTSIDGSLFTADLLQPRGGQTLGGTYRPFTSVANAGPITLTFDSASTGTLSWAGGTFPIGRFDIIPNGLAAPPRPNQPEPGWWWNPQESGRGFFIEWQDGTADLAGYMYDDAGNPVWYITVVPTPDPTRLSGNWLQFGSGMTLTGTWRPHQLVNSSVAPVSVTFTSATTAVMTLPGGRTTNLLRHRF